jgi:hypothetical protein
LSLCLVSSCGRSDAAAPQSAERAPAAAQAPQSSFALERSFRERGIRKSAFTFLAQGGPEVVHSITASAELRLPEMEFPLSVSQRLQFEVEWVGSAASGRVELSCGEPPRTVALDVVYAR